MTKKRRRTLAEWVVTTKPYHGVKALLSRIVLPGFQGIHLWEVLEFFAQGIKHGSVAVRAGSLSFSFFLAIFPGILFFFTLMPYLPIENLNAEVLSIMDDLLPADTFKAMEGTITDIVSRKRTGLLSIGLIFALYFSTNGVSSIIVAFNRTYHTYETRTWWREKVTAIGLTILGFLSIIITAVLIVIGDSTIKLFISADNVNATAFFVGFIKLLVMAAMTYLGVSTLYYYGPAKKVRFKFFSAGSTAATILFIASSYGFSVYLDYFNTYNKLYGSIGTIILLMVWINLNAWVLLLGFELNASIRSAKHKRLKPPEDIN